ncbi:MAG: thiol protease/hemagglutinin PrtT [Saprospiraceae bacterium]
MKKILFLFHILAIASAQVFAQTVSEANARQVATHFFQTMSKLEQVEMTAVSLPARQSGPAPFLVFQPQGSVGFVLVAGTQSSVPILGYSTESNFPVDEAPPAFLFMLDEYRKSLDYIVEHRLKPTPDITRQWHDLAAGKLSLPEGASVLPLLKTQWNQDGPYNKACPKNAQGDKTAYTGCVATAMAQVMRYWNYPVNTASTFHQYVDGDCNDEVCGSFSSNIGGPWYDWGSMPNTLSGASNYSINQVAKLMFDCGVSVDMDYGIDASGAFEVNIPGALTGFFGYGPCWIDHPDNPADEDWQQGIKDQLNYSSPVIYSGDGNGRHTWVCDGYDVLGQFHMNWGWGGSADNFFWLDNLHPDVYDLTENHTAVVDIRPPGCIGYYVGGIVFPNGTFSGSAAHNIEITSGTVPAPAFSNLHAGDMITLKPGFTAQIGSTFRAWIEGCNGQFTSNGDDRSEAETHVTSELGQLLTVFPNPFTDHVRIRAHLTEPGLASLTLFDFSGRVVQTIECATLAESGQFETELQTTGLAAGIYLLQLQYAGGQRAAKLVKTGEK